VGRGAKTVVSLFVSLTIGGNRTDFLPRPNNDLESYARIVTLNSVEEEEEEGEKKSK
jgi:hypothetical protein